MKLDDDNSTRPGSRTAASGARAPRHLRSLVLGWTDPDSGERLTARIHGGEGLLPELVRNGFELQGFELLAGDDTCERRDPGVSVWFTRFARAARSDAGAGEGLGVAS